MMSIRLRRRPRVKTWWRIATLALAGTGAGLGCSDGASEFSGDVTRPPSPPVAQCVLPSTPVGASAAPSIASVDAPQESISCDIPTDEIFVGHPRGESPTLTDPAFRFPGEPGTELWLHDDRVVGVVVSGQPLAVPLGILWWHEVVNLRVSDRPLAITYAPLTGSHLVIDRGALGGVEFAMSGLFFRNHTLLFDRSPDGGNSFWAPMSFQAVCGPCQSVPLTPVASTEMTWGAWRRLHPDTRVASANTGFDVDYTREGYPFGEYDVPDNPELLFPTHRPLDERLPPKSRVLGVPEPDGSGGRTDRAHGFAYPILASAGPRLAVHLDPPRVAEGYVVFWDEEAAGAAAFRPQAGAQRLTFEATEDGYRDSETGTLWDLAGHAVDGPLAGERLEPVADAFVAFWFAWPEFYPEIEVWEP